MPGGRHMSLRKRFASGVENAAPAPEFGKNSFDILSRPVVDPLVSGAVKLPLPAAAPGPPRFPRLNNGAFASLGPGSSTLIFSITGPIVRSGVGARSGMPGAGLSV
jgi:hypothetical protein